MTRDQLRAIAPQAAAALDEEDARKRAGTGAAAALRALRGEPPPSSPAPAEKAPQIKAPRVRQRVGDGMNKTERAFSLYLPTLANAGTIRFNSVSFELANGLRFKPDFLVGMHTAYEVKGPWASRDAFPRLKMAARLYPEITWFLATEKKGGGFGEGWDIQQILP